MIILEPSRTIKQSTKLDFNLFSQLLTTMLEKNHKRKIDIVAKVHKSRTPGASYCMPEEEDHEFTIQLDLSNTKRRYIVSSLLHEVRHCIQKNLFNSWPEYTAMKTWKDYYLAKEEVDARKMERLTTQFLKAYDSMEEMGKMFTKLKLNKLG